MASDRDLAQLVERLRARPRITVMTGAGVSAASGVPTFRGENGLWKRHRPEELATPEAFERDPALVREWYTWRRRRIAACKPNRAHVVLADWSRRYPAFTLISQNVDGLHERAGTADVIQFHGSIWDVRCWHACASSPSHWRDDSVPLPTIPATCPHCGGSTRPCVVWFGEAIDPVVIARSELATQCDLFLTIGTSSLVYSAAALVQQARRHGAFTVELNPEATPLSGRIDLVLRGRAEDLLDAVDRQLTRTA